MYKFLQNSRGRNVKLIEERILSDGKILPGNIIKVGSFLNHQIDVNLLMEAGRETMRIFNGEGITKLVTAATSGIAVATAYGAVFNLPVVFAKKGETSNMSDDVYRSNVHSYTHGNDYVMKIEKQFLSKNDRVLIVDDFLANGAALEGLIDVVSQSGAQIVGCSIVIEKGFQDGGKRIRERGIRVESLAIIDSIDGGKITFRN